MDMNDVAARGLVLLGCGKMGSALLAGWLRGGLPAMSVWVIDPAPSDWLRGTGVHINTDLPANPAIALIAVKPQAYVFHLIEALAAAGVAQGLAPELAMTLAKATVGGAGQLAEDADEGPDRLRVNVTSPNGTTQAALEVLMDEKTGFPALLTRAVAAAANRSRELSRG